MEEAKGVICPVCKLAVKRAAPVGPPMADNRVPHLGCWIRTRQGVTDHASDQQPRRRRSRKWQRRSRRKRAILSLPEASLSSRSPSLLFWRSSGCWISP